MSYVEMDKVCHPKIKGCLGCIWDLALPPPYSPQQRARLVGIQIFIEMFWIFILSGNILDDESESLDVWL